MDFSDITTWIFDLDNTLYPPESNLFGQIEKKMTAHLQNMLGVEKAEADQLRMHYWRDYGTTLAGLMAEHDIDPNAYLLDVHDIDFSVLRPAPDLDRAIAALPGRKIIHTNADSTYADRVLDHLGLRGIEAIHGIEEVGFHPKPDPRSYAAVMTAEGFDPSKAAMFEDDPRNLSQPARLGMRTILVGEGRLGPDAMTVGTPAGDHIQHRTHDLTAFLRSLV
ncbi:pyrimidine 5'-nucleotidase [Paracoccus aerodenitrificans]|uniref:pyrimidine 5'-nucleotidase n=1 Tax=Paracoccus aerodenitrificans TaxID=3017781 RepID=UPI0022F031C9|nr:pyrimidine 5'-nucleotidase [Paracoccus aerodenitrificans]WBU64608.1 pyrimidine 5'-nucleotidase [Paracoccus aerodenitrificans]